MNKELHSVEIGDTLIDAQVTEDEATLNFKNGEAITFSSEHSQDCCEHVYADFKPLQWIIGDLQGRITEKVVVKGVEGMGFLLCFYDGYRASAKVFIPCYNYQNGYYSSGLDLRIKRGETATDISISDYVEDSE